MIDYKVIEREAHKVREGTIVITNSEFHYQVVKSTIKENSDVWFHWTLMSIGTSSGCVFMKTNWETDLPFVDTIRQYLKDQFHQEVVRFLDPSEYSLVIKEKGD